MKNCSAGQSWESGSPPRLKATILIVTHDAGIAAQCGRVLKLRDGSQLAQKLRHFRL
jgi:hypothetical protein